MVSDRVATHYGNGGLAEKIAGGLRRSGRDLGGLTTADLAPYDEFHFRGRKATLELASRMNLDKDSQVLDIGSGLGGPARTLAERYGCHVTGIDLTQEFCDVAATLSGWLGQGANTRFVQGDATLLPFPAARFDAAMTIHVAMNIPDKQKVYEEARRVLKPGGIFAVYDILQGEGGELAYPVPWAKEPSLSHLVTLDEMQALLSAAGFRILDVHDSSDESLAAFAAAAANLEQADQAKVASPTQILFGDKFSEMAQNQLRGLEERRMRTVSYICRA
jgi:ubiquinone/menaquinone biosynthesis C-methylase UbiE